MLTSTGLGLVGCENWIQAVQWWTGAAPVSSGLMTVVWQLGVAGWLGPVGRWERSVGSGPVGWWPGTLLSYWRCTEETEDSEEGGGRVKTGG